jgi:hypothetical protein
MHYASKRGQKKSHMKLNQPDVEEPLLEKKEPLKHYDLRTKAEIRADEKREANEAKKIKIRIDVPTNSAVPNSPVRKRSKQNVVPEGREVRERHKAAAEEEAREDQEYHRQEERKYQEMKKQLADTQRQLAELQNRPAPRLVIPQMSTGPKVLSNGKENNKENAARARIDAQRDFENYQRANAPPSTTPQDLHSRTDPIGQVLNKQPDRAREPRKSRTNG